MGKQKRSWQGESGSAGRRKRKCNFEKALPAVSDPMLGGNQQWEEHSCTDAFWCVCFVSADMDDSGFLEDDGTVEGGVVGEPTEESQGAVEPSESGSPELLG